MTLAQTTRTVCASGCDHTSIQVAIDACSNGDTVEIWDGTYNEHDLDFGGKAITVRSKDGADNCIIDCGGNGRGFIFDSSESSSSILDDLTIQDADATSSPGGGVYCNDASPIIRNCIIKSCFAADGGAIAAQNGSGATIEDCIIEGNWAASRGGGIHIDTSSVTVTGCIISGNGQREGEFDTAQGGGVQLDVGDLIISDCILQENVATTGGGLHAIKGITLNAADLLIQDNQATAGNAGGVYVAGDDTSEETFVRCSIIGNTCDGAPGGGILVGNLQGTNTASFTNCLIADNTCIDPPYGGAGGVMLAGADVTFVNCSVANNSTNAASGGGAMLNLGATVALKNCIIWGNEVDGSPDQLEGSYTLTWCDIEGGYSGTGNIDADPVFANDANGDYRLSRGSPCIDQAKNSDCTGDCNDGGDLRAVTRKSDHLCTSDEGDGSAPIIDMGCYEASKGLIYVDKDATGGHDGSSWANAYVDLQDAFGQAGDDTFPDYDPAACEVWVADGTYKTSPCSTCSDGDKQQSFALIDGVGIYGKFAGTETARSQRGSATTPETILTGLIGVASPSTAYHVVTAPSGVTSTAVLDGFTIKKGKANGSSGDLDKGGGILIEGSPHLEGLSIKENYAKNGGGAYIKSGNPSFTDCAFIDNDANDGSGGGSGAGVYVASGGSGSLAFLRCNFNNNTSLDHGGGVYTAGTGAEPQFTNCLFYRNDADKEDNSTRGGAIYTNRKMILLNCTLAKNWAGENNGGGGIYNTGDDADSILRNCILWRNEAGGTHNGEADQIAIAGGADVEAFESCIEDLDTLDESGHNNTPDNPQFQNFDSDNYVLKGDNCSGGNCLSFAVDDGEDDYCVDECEEDGDLNKATRKIDLEPNGEQVDMGALETQSG